MHGVFMDIFGIGVLLTGASGIGKSELALGLINMGHRLVADDAVDFERVAHDSIIGTCPPILQDFLEVRGLGILNIRVMYGDKAIKENKRLQLIVNIVAFNKEDLLAIDRLHGMYRSQTIIGTDIPEVTIPVAPGRNMAALVEGAVRNQVLKHTGYHASDEFIKRQNQLLSGEETP